MTTKVEEFRRTELRVSLSADQNKTISELEDQLEADNGLNYTKKAIVQEAIELGLKQLKRKHL